LPSQDCPQLAGVRIADLEKQSNRMTAKHKNAGNGNTVANNRRFEFDEADTPRREAINGLQFEGLQIKRWFEGGKPVGRELVGEDPCGVGLGRNGHGDLLPTEVGLGRLAWSKNFFFFFFFEWRSPTPRNRARIELNRSYGKQASIF
jgi:hypothetical protein